MKLIHDGVTFEGTPGEIKELMTAMGAEFPNSTESKDTDGPAKDTTPLKKGDRAKLLSTKGALAGFTAGEEVIVRNLELWGRYDLEVEGVSHGTIGFTDADNLEKITFEVGDRVIALTDGEFDGIEAGEIGEVTDIDAGIGDGDPYSIEVTVGDEDDFFRPQDLELVAGEVEEKSAAKFAKIGRKPGEFKKGDIVRVKWIKGKGVVDEIAEIKSGPVGNGLDGNYYLNNGEQQTLGDDIELIAPVESRVDVD